MLLQSKKHTCFFVPQSLLLFRDLLLPDNHVGSCLVLCWTLFVVF